MKNTKQKRLEGIRTSISEKKKEDYGTIHSAVSDFLKDKNQSLSTDLTRKFHAYWDNLPCESTQGKFCRAICDEVYWIENRVLQRGPIQFIVAHYGLFFEFLKKNEELKGLTIDDIGAFTAEFNSRIKSIKEPDPVLDSLEQYVCFLQDEYEPYAYSSDVFPEQRDGALFVSQNPIDFYHKWLNRSMPKIHFELLKFCVRKNLPKYENDLNKIALNFHLDKETAIHIFSENWAVRKLLDYLKLSKYKFKIKDREIDYFQLNSPIRALVNECRNGYSQLLSAFPKKSDLHFFMDLMCKDKVHPQCSPLVVIERKQYEDKRYEVEYRTWASFDEFCDVFATEFPTAKDLDPCSTPFVRIGDTIFCPSSILANYDLVYGFIQAFNRNVSRQNGNQQKRSLELEQQLNEVLSKLPNCKCQPYSHGSNTPGDADIVLSDDSDVLLIQIKKPNYAMNPADRARDRLQLDEKAAAQLNDFEKAHKETVCDGRRVTKWIVSSFEDCRTVIDGCRKVSYLDLVYLHPPVIFDTLSRYIEFIEGGESIKNLMLILKKESNDFLRRELGKPLPIVSPVSYKTEVRPSDICDEAKSLYFEFGNPANSLDTESGQELCKRIRNFSDEHPGNPMILWCLAKIYEYKHLYRKSEECFLQVLGALPDDPCTMVELKSLYYKWSGEIGRDKPGQTRAILNKIGEINKRFERLYWFLDENEYYPSTLFKIQ